MNGSLYLAWQYLRRNPVIAGVLTAALTLIILLPAVLILVLDDASGHLRERAKSTPLILGAKGSLLEMVLGTLYFEDPSPQVFRMSQVDRLRKLDHGRVIPIHSGHRVRGAVLVATTNDYFSLRRLELGRGESASLPGGCVLGAQCSDRLGLDVGDTLPASMGEAFDLSQPPLQMKVTGILRETGTPDDHVIFTDLKTAWIIDGLGHGHPEDSGHGTPTAQPDTVVTPENLQHLHFHGHEDEFPVTAAIIEPRNDRARTLLLGEFLSPEETVQLVRPEETMDSLLSTVLTVRRYVVALVGVVSGVTLGVIGLVIVLSIRLRRGEIRTMAKIGCSRHTVFTILGAQISMILLASTFLATVLTVMAASFGDPLIRWLVFR